MTINNTLKVLSITVMALSVIGFVVAPVVGVSMFLGAVAGYALANIAD
jgi:hypothetical protein